MLTEQQKDAARERFHAAAANARKRLIPGDRLRVTRCPGTKRWIIFAGWDGDWIISKSGISEYAASNVDRLNGAPIDFCDMTGLGVAKVLHSPLSDELPEGRLASGSAECAMTPGRIAYEAAAAATGCPQPWAEANQAKWEAAGQAVALLSAPVSPLVLYACMVTDCWESWQISLHESKVGAWKAGRTWLLERYESGHESRRLIGKSEYDFMNRHQSFRVARLEVRP